MNSNEMKRHSVRAEHSTNFTYTSTSIRMSMESAIDRMDYTFAQELMDHPDLHSDLEYMKDLDLPVLKLYIAAIISTCTDYAIQKQLPKDVAAAIKTDRTYLAKCFKQETGLCMTNYIRSAKMELAIELMESNLYKLNEISELLGYSNYTYFSRVFYKTYGITPNQYNNTKAPIPNIN